MTEGSPDPRVEAGAKALDEWRQKAPIHDLLGVGSNRRAAEIVLRAADAVEPRVDRAFVIYEIATTGEGVVGRPVGVYTTRAKAVIARDAIREAGRNAGWLEFLVDKPLALASEEKAE